MRKAKAVAPSLEEHVIGYDFESLPQSVQRKFFSPLERLQIQQQAVTASEPASESSSTPFGRAHSRRRAFTVGNQRQEPQFTEAEAAFFISLPEKVKKQAFSREEQVILLAKSEALLPPTRTLEVDEVAIAKQRFNDFHFDFPPTDSPDSVEFQKRRSSFSTYNPRRPSISTFSRSRKGWDADSSVFFIDTMDSPSVRRLRPAGCRRTMSLSGPPPSRHSVCSTVAVPVSPLFSFPAEYQSRHQRSQSSALPLRRTSVTPPIPTFDAEAKYYQDPETRTKLRTYLSPQKFDEAIEFGFPSTTELDVPKPHYQLPPVAKHSRKFSRDMHTFLRDGKLSYIEDKASENQGLDSDGESIAEIDSPRTPSSTGLSFRIHGRQMTSIDSNGLPISQSSPGYMNREMTLRMTLTRPELRADEEALYGWQTQSQHQPQHQVQQQPQYQVQHQPHYHPSSQPQYQPQHQHHKSIATATVQDDPLALEELIFTDDQTGTSGPFYVKPKPRGGLVSRLLKRASLKGR